MKPDPSASAPAGASASPLIFDWKHRPRTWPRLSFWLALILLAHLAGFIIFSVRSPAPARAMPVPSTIILAADQTANPAESAIPTTLAGLLTPAESANLDLPTLAPADPDPPSFSNHVLARQPWPARPERAAWPEVSRVSEPVLPPATAPAALPDPATPAPRDDSPPR